MTDILPPIIVSRREAARLLSCGRTTGGGVRHIDALLDAGELEGLNDGRHIKITRASLERYIARQVAVRKARRLRHEEAPVA